MPGPILAALGSLLGGGGAISNAIATVIDRRVVDVNLASEIKGEIEKSMASAEIQMALQQLEINKIEAASDKWWKAGARPFIMWMGGLGFGVQFVIVPLIGYTYSLFGHTAPGPLELDPMLYTVLLGILGLNIGARTVEKVKGVA